MVYLNDNELKSIPPAINSLINLTKLDLSRNRKQRKGFPLYPPLIIYPINCSALHTYGQHEGTEEPALPRHEHERPGKAAGSSDQFDCIAGVVLERHDDGVPARKLWPTGQPEDIGVARKSITHPAQVHLPADDVAAFRHWPERVLGIGEGGGNRGSLIS